MFKQIAGLSLSLFVCAYAYGQTADDCIAQYEAAKPQFQAAAPGAPVNCVQNGHIISLDAEGPLPAAGCEGGGWDHWHLQARAVLGNEPSCTVRLLGLDDREGCGTPEFQLDLPANEGAKWRNYLRSECRN
jgi:hypothetical protein